MGTALRRRCRGWVSAGGAIEILKNRIVEAVFGRSFPPARRLSVRERIATWIKLPQFAEPRGCLTVVEFPQLPFVPRRAFYVCGVPAGTSRGGHAHREEMQFLICLAGRIDVELRTATGHDMVACRPDGRGLLIVPGIWAREIYLDENSILLVLSSHPYDPGSMASEPGTAPR